MITKKLKIIFGLSIPIFMAHGVEEFMTHFYDTDTHTGAVFGALSELSNHGATFVIFQAMFGLLLVISFLLILGERWRFNVLAIVGLVYIYELHHLYKAVVIGGYYPGLYTSLVFPVLAFFFWKEWLHAKKQIK